MLSYPQWLDRRIACRAAEYPLRPSQVSFSILTPVYQKSDAGFLAEAARSIFTQTCQSFQWIILAQGPMSSALDEALAELANHPQCLLLRQERNLGIISGLRRCLDRATGDYLLPVDADDLLTPDALQVMRYSIWRNHHPALLYSDEDRLENGIPCTPYFRPDWDPVFALSSSYIWHLCAIHRATAQELGVYTDQEADWCHDWDTVLRLAAAGRTIVHVPEVLYHWRQHSVSSTNREEPEPASLQSQRHVLERWANNHPGRELFSVEKFPILADAPRYWIARRAVSPPPLALLGYGGDPALLTEAVCSALSSTDAVSEIHLVGIPDVPKGMRERIASLTGSRTTRTVVWPQAKPHDLLLALSNSPSQAIAVLSQHITIQEGWAWEADRLLRLHSEVSVVAARVLDRSGRVLSAGEIFGFGGISGSPDAGRSQCDPGLYGIALKSRCVSAPHPWFFVVRRTDFVDALRTLPPEASWGVLGIWLGGLFAESRRLVAFSPSLNVFRRTAEPIHAAIEPAEARALARRFIRLIPDFRGYSKWYRWTSQEAYAART